MCALYITKQYMSDNRMRQVRLCISLDNPVNFAAMLWWCSSLIVVHSVHCCFVSLCEIFLKANKLCKCEPSLLDIIFKV